jgi:hypothetical protein
VGKPDGRHATSAAPGKHVRPQAACLRHHETLVALEKREKKTLKGALTSEISNHDVLLKCKRTVYIMARKYTRNLHLVNPSCTDLR